MHVKTRRDERRRTSLSGLQAWKDSGKQRREGGEGGGGGAITPSEHLKLLAGLSSAAPPVSTPVPQACRGICGRWKHIPLLPPVALLLNFIRSFVPGLYSLFTAASYTKTTHPSLKQVGCECVRQWACALFVRVLARCARRASCGRASACARVSFPFLPLSQTYFLGS